MEMVVVVMACVITRGGGSGGSFSIIFLKELIVAYVQGWFRGYKGCSHARCHFKGVLLSTSISNPLLIPARLPSLQPSHPACQGAAWAPLGGPAGVAMENLQLDLLRVSTTKQRGEGY